MIGSARSARPEPVIFSARKRDIRHHSTMSVSGNVAVAETSYQLVECLNAEREVVGSIPWTNHYSGS